MNVLEQANKCWRSTFKRKCLYSCLSETDIAENFQIHVDLFVCACACVHFCKRVRARACVCVCLCQSMRVRCDIDALLLFLLFFFFFFFLQRIYTMLPLFTSTMLYSSYHGSCCAGQP